MRTLWIDPAEVFFNEAIRVDQGIAVMLGIEDDGGVYLDWLRPPLGEIRLMTGRQGRGAVAEADVLRGEVTVTETGTELRPYVLESDSGYVLHMLGPVMRG